MFDNHKANPGTYFKPLLDGREARSGELGQVSKSSDHKSGRLSKLGDAELASDGHLVDGSENNSCSMSESPSSMHFPQGVRIGKFRKMSYGCPTMLAIIPCSSASSNAPTGVGATICRCSILKRPRRKAFGLERPGFSSGQRTAKLFNSAKMSSGSQLSSPISVALSANLSQASRSLGEYALRALLRSEWSGSDSRSDDDSSSGIYLFLLAIMTRDVIALRAQ
jgi:hypothetical protein